MHKSMHLMKRCFHTKFTFLFPILFAVSQSAFGENTFSSPQDFQTAADNTFEILSNIYKQSTPGNCPSPVGDSCNYWQLGSAFSTIVDYFSMTNPASQAKDFAPVVLSSYQVTSHVFDSACWYDDFGWWSVSAHEAASQEKLWPDHTEKFAQISKDNWLSQQPATNVWASCQNSAECMTNYKDLEPYFDGGVHNYFWAKVKIPGVCHTPADPFTDPLAGRQNTVTNGLYALSAFYNLPKDAAAPAIREQTFLNNWFTFGYPNPDTSLLKTLATGAQAVRERVSTYKNQQVDPVFDPNLVWAGDQGLILGELVAYMNSGIPSHDELSHLLSLAQNIIDGGLQYLANQNAGELYSWSRTEGPARSTIGQPPGDDPWDYNLGTAVYLHHFLYAYRTNSALHSYIDNNPQYKNLILAAAKKLLSSNDGLCYPDSAHCGALAKYNNKLEILVAAIEFSKSN